MAYTPIANIGPVCNSIKPLLGIRLATNSTKPKLTARNTLYNGLRISHHNTIRVHFCWLKSNLRTDCKAVTKRELGTLFRLFHYYQLRNIRMFQNPKLLMVRWFPKSRNTSKKKSDIYSANLIPLLPIKIAFPNRPSSSFTSKFNTPRGQTDEQTPHPTHELRTMFWPRCAYHRTSMPISQ